MAVDLDAERGRLITFLVLHILGGNVGMLLILSTTLVSGKILRHAVFLNFCTTWMVFSGSYVLLFYAGQIDRPFPNFLLCLTQAAMIYGSDAMIGVSSVVFAMHLFMAIRAAVHPKDVLRLQKIPLFAILAVPYVAYLLVFLVAFLSGNTHPDLVHRSSLYCTIKMGHVAGLGTGIAVLGIVASVVVETLTILMLLRNWQKIRDAKTIRFLAFRTITSTVFSVLGVFSCIAFLVDSKSPVPNMVLACMSMAMFLVFGIQSDLLRVWCFWKKDQGIKAPAPADHTSDSASPV